MHIDWQKMDGLLPCIVQDATTAQVLMLGYMNEAALEKTLETKKVTFFSRSKGRLWTKGETSGNVLHFVRLSTDCDGDALIVLARPAGHTCHLNRPSCFTVEPPALHTLGALQETIAERAASPSAESYTSSLLQDGVRRCAQKVGEEGVEVALAAVAQEDEALLEESADLLYHLLVVLQARGLGLEEVLEVLKKRSL